MKTSDRPDGWVYVLTHPAWSKIGMVKIGMTRVDPAKRGLKIASASGLIARPRVHCCLWVSDRSATERMVHRELDRFRVRRRRELFRVTPEHAAAVLRGLSATTTVARRPWRKRLRSLLFDAIFSLGARR